MIRYLGGKGSLSMWEVEWLGEGERQVDNAMSRGCQCFAV